MFFSSGDREEEITARLDALAAIVGRWTDDVDTRLKSIKIAWNVVDGHLVPSLDVEFYER